MSAPAPDEMAAVMRGWISLALIVSIVISAPRSFPASTACFLSASSAAGTKSTQRTMWSFWPWAYAGARPEARMPASPAEAPPETLRKDRRFIVPAISASLRAGAGLRPRPSDVKPRILGYRQARPVGVAVHPVTGTALRRALRAPAIAHVSPGQWGSSFGAREIAMIGTRATGPFEP